MLSHSRTWEVKKKALRRELERFAARSPVLAVLGFHDHGSAIRTVVRFDTETLVKRGSRIIRAGPVEAGIRYEERYLSEAPVPWEIVTLLSPASVFHPNVNVAGALCLGHPEPALPMAEILHRTWAAITFNLRLVNTIPWQGLNHEAAAYVRANPGRLPLVATGLLEPKAGPKENR